MLVLVKPLNDAVRFILGNLSNALAKKRIV